VATIGEMVVNLRTNSAQFNSGMDAAAEKTRKVGASARTTQEGLSKLAAKGFGELIPISNRAENALERVFQKMSEGAGIMRVLGTAGIALGAALLAFKVGSLVGDWLALGTSVENYKKQLEDARKEQDALVASMNKQRDLTRGLDKELAGLNGQWEETIRLEREQRDAQIRATFPNANGTRDALLAKSAAIATEATRVELEKQRAASEKFNADTLADLVKAREERFKVWQSETDIFVKNLSARAKARTDFEAQFGQGGLPGLSQTQGVREALDVQQQFQTELRHLAFGQREGIFSQTDVNEGLENIRLRAEAAGQSIKEKFGGAFPSVDAAVQRALGSVDNLGSEFEKARGFVDKTVPTLGALTAGLDTFRGMLSSMPEATQAAEGAINTLRGSYDELTASINRSVQAAAVLAQVAAGNV
jgi:conjugal transfer/entry exclusion protein